MAHADAYEAPKLTEYGSIEDWTHAVAEVSVIADLEEPSVEVIVTVNT